MPTSDDLAHATVAGLATRIRERQLSPVEAVEAAIERIEAANDRLNAFVHLGFDDARERAREAERAVTSGQELGPLHGVPTAMKDLFDFKPGWPSTFGGVRALKDFVPDFSCAWVERMERAGAIILGKTNSPVMGFRGTCDNPLFGPSRNPFDHSRNTGGSSGGSAAAVAAGLVPVAEGTDGGGSIRIPASWCGIYGYKHSFGRVPYIARPNAFTGLNPFLFEGPLTRTVEDAALVVDAIAGYDPRDPFALDEPANLSGAVGRSINGWRIAYSPDFDVFPVDRRVAEVVGDAVRAFEREGAHVEEVKLGIERDQRELSDLWCRLIIPINVEFFENMKAQGLDLLGEHRDDFPPEYLRWIDEGYRLTVPQLARDQQMRSEIYDAIQGVFENYDLLVTPTLACLAVENSDDGNTKGPTEINGVEVDPLIGWCLTYFINFSGHPAASIPAGMAEGRLPVGMQIIGKRYADADVLAASAAFERVRPWQETYRMASALPVSPALARRP
jgi:amidase/aspartyl-tRNA(Asn)/glutamyl-tRNA(Gln) amidotransferase subunit A